MDIIKKLPPHVANLIAAGEVVQNPASVVKELCENSADAGADKITVEFTDGAMTFLRVTDNGCGMSPADAVMAFQRHATSKISQGDDLEKLMTHGFRGEALAAIAAVSRVDLLTRPRDSIEGTAISLEGGMVSDNSSAGCPEGTTIVVRDIFFNTPARMKYVRKNSQEASSVIAAVQLQALAHPEIAYRMIRDGREILNTSGSGDVRSAIYDVYGREYASSLLEIRSRSETSSVYGYITRPTASRGNRAGQHFIVNKRPISSKLLSAALEEGCKTRIPASRFPGCVIYIDVKPYSVDVNVHPSKLEVKFSREREIYNDLYHAVLSAMTGDEGRPELKFREAVRPSPGAARGGTGVFRSMTVDEYRRMLESGASLYHGRAAGRDAAAALPGEAAAAGENVPAPEATQAPGPDARTEKTAAGGEAPLAAGGSGIPACKEGPSEDGSLREREAPDAKKAAQSAVSAAEAEKNEHEADGRLAPEGPVSGRRGETAGPVPDDPGVAAEALSGYTIIGEAFDTYIIVQERDGLLLIDKHAAHERILFEKLKEEQGPPMSQLLIVPETVQLMPKEAQALLNHAEELSAAGFEAEDFADGCLLVRQIPSCLDLGELPAVLQEMAQELIRGKDKPTYYKRERMLYTLACRSAVKAGHKSSCRELEDLARQVMTRSDIRYCPHGRPVTVSISRSSLERQFGR